MIKNKFLYIFGGRYIVHVIVVIIAVFVATSNIQAQEKRGSLIKFDNKALINKIVKAGEFEDGQKLVEESIDIGQIASKKQNLFYSDERKNSLTYRDKILVDSNEFEIQSEPVNNSETKAKNFIPKKRDKIIYYTVQTGDSVYSIAKKFNITVNTIIWENNLNSRGFIKPGQKLAILPTVGVTYKVKRNDTLIKIAKKFNTTEQEIIKINKIKNSNNLQIGQKLIIPGARKVYERKTSPKRTNYIVRKKKKIIKSVVKSSTKLHWPASCHVITQYFHWRHHGLDIACKHGTPIYAAEDGVVVAAGWATGYGKRIRIDHGNGLVTLYGHCSKLYVRAGQAVNRGDIICAEGTTGWSTGPHLHFEVRKKGVKKNPLTYLR